MIIKSLFTNYDGTQWFLKYIQPVKSRLAKSFINIYTCLCRIITMELNDFWKLYSPSLVGWYYLSQRIWCQFITSSSNLKKRNLIQTWYYHVKKTTLQFGYSLKKQLDYLILQVSSKKITEIPYIPSIILKNNWNPLYFGYHLKNN